MTVLYSTVMTLFITWPVDGHLSCFQFSPLQLMLVNIWHRCSWVHVSLGCICFAVELMCQRVCMSSVLLDVGWIAVQSGCSYYHSHQLYMGVPVAPHLLHCNFGQLQCTSEFCQSDGCKKLMCTLNTRSAPFPQLFWDIQRTVWSHFSICRGPESSWGEA